MLFNEIHNKTQSQQVTEYCLTPRQRCRGVTSMRMRLASRQLPESGRAAF